MGESDQAGLDQAGPDLPSVLCDVGATVADPATMSAGVLWRLTESGRQLDANLVRLAPGQRVDLHAEPELDVLVMVVDGAGFLATGNLDPADVIRPAEAASNSADVIRPAEAASNPADVIRPAEAASNTDEPLALSAGLLVWLPRGATRGLSAGGQGLSYVTVHSRRPGMRIGRRPPDAAS